MDRATREELQRALKALREHRRRLEAQIESIENILAASGSRRLRGRRKRRPRARRRI